MLKKHRVSHFVFSNITHFVLCIFIGMFSMSLLVLAKVTKVEITSRKVLSNSMQNSRYGPYEVMKGKIYLEVNPDNPANEQTVDLKLAERNPSGNVEFSTEFELHKPVKAEFGNHRLIYFVNNRGNKLAEWHFNHMAGKNWLYSQGWSYLWCGWNCDVIDSDKKLNIKVPIVTNHGKTIKGKIYSELISYSDQLVYNLPVVWGGSLAYPPDPKEKSNASLTMRRYRWEKPVKIPREKWSFGRFQDGKIMPDQNVIYLKDGFKPGWLYDLVYIGKDPKVTGLGLAAIRDVVSFFKYEKADDYHFPNPLSGDIDRAYAWGHSQSARLLNHFVYQNFNGDEKNKIVFDGIIANCAGGGKGLFNSRFAQPTRHGSHLEDNLYPIDFFPFATVKQTDPVAGKQADAFEKARKSGFLPKMMFVNSSTDYWTRAASLLHTDVEGKEDIAIDPNVRIYSVAGIAHTESRIGIIGRALLTALDEWASYGIKPPKSQIPKISEGTLVDFETWRKNFPDIPGVIFPKSFYHPYRLDLGATWDTEGIAGNVPPQIGPRYVCLVPQVDQDGNEIAGIRFPEISVPLATFTGWSQRNPSFSLTLRRNSGRVWPLPWTTEERNKTNDPRKSILERYPTKAEYLSEAIKSVLNLKRQRLILDEDVTMLLKEAAEQDYWPVIGNETQVAIKEVAAQPAELNQRETSLLTVIFEGPKDQVISVKAVVREASHNRYVFNDNGRDGDKKANDNVWTGKLYVADAPPGEYHLDIYAFDAKWNPVFLIGTLKEGRGERGSVIVTVK